MKNISVKIKSFTCADIVRLKPAPQKMNNINLLAVKSPPHAGQRSEIFAPVDFKNPFAVRVTAPDTKGRTAVNKIPIFERTGMRSYKSPLLTTHAVPCVVQSEARRPAGPAPGHVRSKSLFTMKSCGSCTRNAPHQFRGIKTQYRTKPDLPHKLMNFLLMHLT